jgi:tol-pal system protein YbgF
LKIIILSFGIVLFMVLAGCAAREDIIILANRTSTLERNITQARDAQEENKNALSKKIDQTEKKIDSQIQPILQNQANTSSQQEALKVQIQTLQGRIEALEHNQKKDQLQLSESAAKEIKDLQARLQRLEKPPALPPPPPAESATKPEKPKEGAQETKEEQKEGKETVKVKPEEIFEAAQGLLKKQAYESAKKKYEEYLKIAPKGKYLEEALFGLGESLYGIKEYEEAILTYQKMIKSYPKSKYIPEALYKQALSFLSLKDTASARLLLEKIVKDFPKSNRATMAQKKLKTL